MRKKKYCAIKFLFYMIMGIGITSGVNGLQFYTPSGTQVATINVSSGNLIFQTNTGKSYQFMNGALGVGTTSPGYPLQVVGTANATTVVVDDNLSYQETNLGSQGAAIAVDWSQGSKAFVTVTGTTSTQNVTFSKPPVVGASGAAHLSLFIDKTGNQGIAFPASVKWQSGLAPSFAQNKKHIVSFYYRGGTYYGVAGLNYP